MNRNDDLLRFTRAALSRRAFLMRAGGVTAGLTVSALLAGCGSGSGNRDLNNGGSGIPVLYSGALTRSNAQMRAVLNPFLAFNVPPLYTLTPAQARLQPSVQDAAQQVARNRDWVYTPTPVASVQDTTIPGPAGAIPIRVYTPTGTGPFPITVYYHGGGWVIATINTYDNSCRALAQAAKSVVISVEYRKGPENRFPAAHEDSYAALQYIFQNAASFGGQAGRIAVAGESAGGNLASAVCRMAKDRGGHMPIYQLLVYPIANSDVTTESYVENADAIPLSRPLAQYFLNNYLNSLAEATNPLISLVRANVTGLPNATVITDEIDPLRSEGQAYAQHLRHANISVRSRNYDEVTHEFFGLTYVIDKAQDAVDFAAEGLRNAFDNVNG